MTVRRPAPMLLASIAVLLAWQPVQVHAQDGERRAGAEPEPVFSLDAAYTADIWHNSGGLREGWRYLDDVDISAELDLERAIGWQGARAYAYMLYTNDKALTDLTGDAQAASNIETGLRALRLVEAWIEQDLGEAATAKIGLYDLNSEFDALEASALFINSAHGIGTDISQSGEAGPSIWPVTSLALRLQAEPSDTLALRAVVADGVPGDPAHPRRTAIRLGHGDGALLAAEADWHHDGVRVLAGGWRYTRELPSHDGVGLARSQGAYLRGEWILSQREHSRLTAFARAGIASGRANMFGRFLAAGLVHDIGEDWNLGVAVAHARTSPSWRKANPSLRAETAIEVTVARRITDWLTLQPDLQYVRHPGAAPGVRDAVLAGLRLTLSADGLFAR